MKLQTLPESNYEDNNEITIQLSTVKITIDEQVMGINRSNQINTSYVDPLKTLEKIKITIILIHLR